MYQNSIKNRITLWFTVFFFLLLISVFILFFMLENSISSRTNQEAIRVLIETHLDELEYTEKYITDDNIEFLLPVNKGYLKIDDTFFTSVEGMYVSIYYKDRLLYGHNPVSISPNLLPFADQTFQRINIDKNTYVVFDKMIANPDLDGLWIRGSFCETLRSIPLSQSSRILFVLFPLIISLALCGGYILASTALAPIDEICRQAALINEGCDLTRRIELRQSNTETQKLADTFNLMFDRLHASFEAEKNFTSNASHELRTPISVISAECEYALEETNPQEWYESLEVIARQNYKMSELVNRLLMFSRLERGTLKLDKQKINLSLLCEEVCCEQKQIHKQNIRLQLQIQLNLTLYADEFLIRQLIINLVDNAYKYGKENGTITVSLFRKNTAVVLKVSDDGIGIPQNELSKIWNRFYRSSITQNDGSSTGLGLSLVRQIAILHHAETLAESRPEHGSTFTVRFPDDSHSN